jgi:hypothetical protein
LFGNWLVSNFYSFDDLKKSSSNLGNTYMYPAKLVTNLSTFLAGRFNNWEITEIEIYSLRLGSDGNVFPRDLDRDYWV